MKKLYRENGSVTLLGMWLLGILTFVSSMLFVYSTREAEINVTDRETYRLQLEAENMLEEEYLRLREDYSEVQRLAGKRYTKLQNGTLGNGWEKSMWCLYENGQLNLVLMFTKDYFTKTHDQFLLQWVLEVDEDEETVHLVRIG